MTSHILNKTVDRAKDNWSVLLIISALFLFSTKTLFNIPLAIMAFIGLYRLVKTPALLKTPEIKLTSILFACLWFPMLLSLIDAEDLSHSSKTVFLYIHFLFSGIFIIDELRNTKTNQKIIYSIFIILTFFCFDAMLQFFFGKNLFGYPYTPPLLGGMFYPRNTLPHFLALLAPVYFEYVRQYKRSFWAYFCLLLYLCVLLLGGKRAAWIIFLSGGMLYAAYLIFVLRAIEWKKMLIPVVLIILALTTLSLSYPPLKHKLTITSGLFSGDYAAINKATAIRLPIWETGVLIVKSHWLNGIGPRGFRHVYADYASTDNFWLMEGRVGQSHPHLTVLEIMIETGIIGITGYLFFWMILVVYARRQLIRKETMSICWLITVIIAVLPYNSHLAFYGSYWASALWWVIPFFIASTRLQDNLSR